jgi:hypothetical protein
MTNPSFQDSAPILDATHATDTSTSASSAGMLSALGSIARIRPGVLPGCRCRIRHQVADPSRSDYGCAPTRRSQCGSPSTATVPTEESTPAPAPPTPVGGAGGEEQRGRAAGYRWRWGRELLFGELPIVLDARDTPQGDVGGPQNPIQPALPRFCAITQRLRRRAQCCSSPFFGAGSGVIRVPGILPDRAANIAPCRCATRCSGTSREVRSHDGPSSSPK